MADDKYIIKEASPVSLPVQMSYLIDKVISDFAKIHQEEGVEAIQRWHDADLWMISKNSWDEESRYSVSQRVTVGAYSDAPHKLTFIPDIVATDSRGVRYILPPESGRELVLRDFDFAEGLASHGTINTSEVKSYLYAAWEKANGLSAKEATVPVA